jgi:hypothetical protein
MRLSEQQNLHGSERESDARQSFRDQEAESDHSDHNGVEQPCGTRTKPHADRAGCIVKELSIIVSCRDPWRENRHGRRRIQTIAEPVGGLMKSPAGFVLKRRLSVREATGLAIER